LKDFLFTGVLGIRTPELGGVFICWFWDGESFSFTRGADGELKLTSFCSSGASFIAPERLEFFIYTP
jgi:hypothetical protein